MQFLCGVLLCPLFLQVEVFSRKCPRIPVTDNLEGGRCFNNCQVVKFVTLLPCVLPTLPSQPITRSLCVYEWVWYVFLAILIAAPNLSMNLTLYK